MSAYICNPEHFAALAVYAVGEHTIGNRDHTADWYEEGTIRKAQDIARELARENIRSVAHRYPNDKDGERPGPCLLDAEIVEAAAIYAGHFLAHPQNITPLQILVLAQSYDYQSCETPDWRDTPAHRHIENITHRAILNLPGYDDAQWRYSQPVPEIEALYEKHT